MPGSRRAPGGFWRCSLPTTGCVFTTWHRGGPNVVQTELLALGIDYRHSRPDHPHTCGKARIERFHQTLKAFLAKQDLRRRSRCSCVQASRRERSPTAGARGQPAWPAPRPDSQVCWSPPVARSARWLQPSSPSPLKRLPLRAASMGHLGALRIRERTDRRRPPRPLGLGTAAFGRSRTLKRCCSGSRQPARHVPASDCWSDARSVPSLCPLTPVDETHLPPPSGDDGDLPVRHRRKLRVSRNTVAALSPVTARHALNAKQRARCSTGQRMPSRRCWMRTEGAGHSDRRAVRPAGLLGRDHDPEEAHTGAAPGVRGGPQLTSAPPSARRVGARSTGRRCRL